MKPPPDPFRRALFEENLLNAAAANAQRSGNIVGAKDLTKIPWPRLPNSPEPLPYYGHDHAKQTSQLAVFIFNTLGKKGDRGNPFDDVELTDRDRELVKNAAFLHDLGRSRPWQENDPGHGLESARLALEVFHDDPGNWGNQDLASDVCRLIMRHSLTADRAAVAKDPLLTALWDAECFEAARFEPNTTAGGGVLRTRLKMVITPWAKTREAQNRWMKYRGWDLA